MEFILPEGYRARVTHLRRCTHDVHGRKLKDGPQYHTVAQARNLLFRVEPKGGITRAEVEEVIPVPPDDHRWRVIASAEAYCSIEDQYDRRAGRVLAIRRALQQTDLKNRRNGEEREVTRR